jgi:thymidylate synthase (FAD)
VKKVVVIGAGPAGLAAAHAAVGLGADVRIFAPKVRTPQRGPIMLQRPIPGITNDHPDGYIKQIVIGGSILDYRYKLYGDVNININGNILQPGYDAWKIDPAYDKLWDMYESLIIPVRVTSKHLQLMHNECDLVVSTAPLNMMCTMPEYHDFRYMYVAITSESSYTDQPDNTIIFNASGEEGWVRSSIVFGIESTEWPYSSAYPNGAYLIRKPISHKCNCFPRVLLTGRFGKFKNETWIDTAYYDTREAIISETFRQEWSRVVLLGVKKEKGKVMERRIYHASRLPGEISTKKEYRSPASKRASLDKGRSKSPSDNGIISVGNDNIEVGLVQDFKDADLEKIGRYSQAASVGAPEKIRTSEDPSEFLRGGLAFQSLEDIRVAFAVRGASRVLTHQLVRTRQAAFKQQSQRDCWYGDMPEFRMPASVWENGATRSSWVAALRVAHQAYNTAIRQDIPYEDARYILPEGTTNFILCEYSLRVFMEMYAYRGCVMFQDEMVATVRAMRDLLVSKHPYLGPHLRISCEKVGKCTYQGRERIEESCDFPWATEDNRAFKPNRYLGDESK